MMSMSIPGAPGSQNSLAGIMSQYKDPRKDIRAQSQELRDQSQEFLTYETIPPELRAQLMQGALGQGPSVAATLGQAGLAQAQRGMLSAAAGAQGMSPALAFRQAMQGGQQTALEMNPQIMAARLQEMEQSRQLALSGLFQERQLQVDPYLGAQQLAMGGYQTLEQSRAAQAAAEAQGGFSLGRTISAGLGGLASGYGQKLAAG